MLLTLVLLWVLNLSLYSRNRLKLPANVRSLEGAFPNLTDLQLNATFLSWAEIQAITTIMPKLQLIEMGYNHLSRLSGGMIRPHDCNVQVINLDTNNCSDWVHLCASFREYHSYVIVSQIVTLLSLSSVKFTAYCFDFQSDRCNTFSKRT